MGESEMALLYYQVTRGYLKWPYCIMQSERVSDMALLYHTVIWGFQGGLLFSWSHLGEPEMAWLSLRVILGNLTWPGCILGSLGGT